MTMDSSLLGALATLNVAAIAYLANSVRLLGNKIDSMVCDPLCKERSGKCRDSICLKLHRLDEEDARIWQRVNSHHHTTTGEVVIPHD